MQSKTDSFKESAWNVIIGYLIGVVSQMVIFPVFGIIIPMSDNFLIAMWFSAVSLARSYVIRRWHDRKTRFEQIKREG